MSVRMDLHCHSVYSDGTCTPSELVCIAAKSKICLFALSDHDTMEGTNEALAEGKRNGVVVLPSVEFDTESPFEMHILGLDVDAAHSEFALALKTLQKRRVQRNEKILKLLEGHGYCIRPYFKESKGNTTRLHIAKAIVEAGYAGTVTEAFIAFLNPGKPGYYHEPRFTPEQVIALIKKAGGIPVLAHPCHIHANVTKVVHELVAMGLMGLEAYYPASTVRQTELFLSLAAQRGLIVTCGSDFHGGNRQGTPIGCAWRDVPCLHATAELLLARHRMRQCI